MLKHRPLALFGLLFTTGIILGISFSEAALVWCAVSVIMLSLLLSDKRFKILKLEAFTKTALLAVFTVPVISILFSSIYAYTVDSTLPTEISGNIKCYVTDIRQTTEGESKIDVRILSPEQVKGKYARIYLTSEYVPDVSDVITFSGSLERTDLKALRAINVYYVSSVSNATFTDEKASDFKASALRFRTKLSRATDRFFGEAKQSAALVKALVLGDASSLDQRTRTVFSRTGTSHILAISGLHFTIIVMSLYTVLKLIYVPKRLRCLLCTCFAFLYCMFIGFTPSATRAAIMCTVIFFNLSAIRTHDPLTSFSIALGLICLFNPYAVFSLSLQLSFSAYFAVILVIFELKPKLFKKSQKSKFRKIYEATVISLLLVTAVNMITFPITVNSFTTFSLISPLSNLFITVAAAPLLYFSCIAVLLSLFPFTAPIAPLIAKIPEAFVTVMETMASLDYITVSNSIKYIAIASVFTVIAIICALALPKEAKIRSFKICLCAFYICIIGTVGIFFALSMTKAVIYSDGKQIITVSDNKATLIDFGGEIETDLFEKCAYTTVDRLILLNCSVSTPKNVETFLTYYKVNTVYLSQCDTSLCTEIKKTAKLYGTAVEEFENSSVITSGDIGISCYSSKYNSVPSVFVDYGDNRVLFYSSNTVPLSKLESNSDTLLVINGTATPTEIYQTLARIKYIGLALDQTKFSQSGYRLDLDGYLNITDTSNSSFTKITIKNGKTRIKLYES